MAGETPKDIDKLRKFHCVQWGAYIQDYSADEYTRDEAVTSFVAYLSHMGVTISQDQTPKVTTGWN